MAEKEQRMGRYTIREHTARRLVAEGHRRLWLTLGVMWGLFLLTTTLIAPWRGGTRLLITMTAAVALAVVSLLILRFVPLRERFVVDVETGKCRIERVYLLPRLGKREIQVPLEAVEQVRCRRQLWRDGTDVEAARFLVELVGQDGGSWRLAEGTQQGPMQEMARLAAEVAGRPLE